ncbi:unnamed protein product [Closterium sp. NIES-64]|nr:unnamed protein product [Closterium sp. NIES-64]
MPFFSPISPLRPPTTALRHPRESALPSPHSARASPRGSQAARLRAQAAAGADEGKESRDGGARERNWESEARGGAGRERPDGAVDGHGAGGQRRLRGRGEAMCEEVRAAAGLQGERRLLHATSPTPLHLTRSSQVALLAGRPHSPGHHISHGPCRAPHAIPCHSLPLPLLLPRPLPSFPFQPPNRPASPPTLAITSLPPTPSLCLLAGANLVVHCVGPSKREPHCTVLEAAILTKHRSLALPITCPMLSKRHCASLPNPLHFAPLSPPSHPLSHPPSPPQTPYVDVCGDVAIAGNARALHGTAVAAGVPASTTDGIFPGASNCAFMASTGGAGPTILTTSLLLGEPATALKHVRCLTRLGPFSLFPQPPPPRPLLLSSFQASACSCPHTAASPSSESPVCREQVRVHFTHSVVVVSRMPAAESGSPSNLFYSFDTAGIHWVMLSSYSPFLPDSRQYTWLKVPLTPSHARNNAVLMPFPMVSLGSFVAPVTRTMTNPFPASLPLTHHASVEQRDLGLVGQGAHAMAGGGAARAVFLLILIRISGTAKTPLRSVPLRSSCAGMIHVTIGDGGNREGPYSNQETREWRLDWSTRQGGVREESDGRSHEARSAVLLHARCVVEERDKSREGEEREGDGGDGRAERNIYEEERIWGLERGEDGQNVDFGAAEGKCDDEEIDDDSNDDADADNFDYDEWEDDGERRGMQGSAADGDWTVPSRLRAPQQGRTAPLAPSSPPPASSRRLAILTAHPRVPGEPPRLTLPVLLPNTLVPPAADRLWGAPPFPPMLHRPRSAAARAAVARVLRQRQETAEGSLREAGRGGDAWGEGQGGMEEHGAGAETRAYGEA